MTTKTPKRSSQRRQAVVDAEVVAPNDSARVLVGARSAVPAVREDAPGASSVFLTWLETKNEKTALNYRGDLGDFSGWYVVEVMRTTDVILTGRSVPTETIGVALQHFVSSTQHRAHETGIRYRTWLERTRKLAPKTINRNLSALRSYIKIAQHVGACPWNLSVEGLEDEGVRDVSGPGPEGYAALVAGAEAKIAAAIESGDHRLRTCWVRNLALLRLYHDAGLRRFEPLTIDYPGDVDLHTNPRVRIQRKKRRAKAWFNLGSSRAVQAMKDWIAVRGSEPGPLFTSTRQGYVGQRLTPRTINKILDVLGSSVGVKVATHGLRHTAATTLLNKTNGDVRAVAEFLGHKGTNIVRVYDDDRQQLARKMGALLDD